MAEIKHFVVLMLENRSFDSMLGRLDGAITGLDGLNPLAANVIGAQSFPAGGNISTQSPMTVPTPDPGESFDDMNQQIFGDKNGRKNGLPATMSGFAANYVAQKKPNSTDIYDPAAVMYAYTEDQVHVLHTLAKSFAVSDRWFASAPCQTWPNRFFAHTGTCLGIVDNDKFMPAGEVPFSAPSIFASLQTANIPWGVYFHDIPQSVLIKDVMPYATEHYHTFDQFIVDAKTGVLPGYSFIEPRYFADIVTGAPPNDQHPPHNVSFAEQLIFDVYSAVRASPLWESTLLLITYDEHGGCYDHVPPPSAVSPDGKVDAKSGFAFDSYGVRVPAVVISPWMAPGTVLRASDGSPPFDHTSIIRTVRDLFGLSTPLTKRDETAPSLLPFLTLAAPTNGGPANLANPNAKADRTLLQEIGASSANVFQNTLGDAMELLANEQPSLIPTGAGTVAEVGTKAKINLGKLLGF